VDEVVATIRASEDAAAARVALMTRRWPAAAIAAYIGLIDDPSHRMNEDGTYNLSETQARAILDLRLQRLTQLGVKEVTDELEALAAKITDFLDILRSRARILGIIGAELGEIRALFATPRRTQFIEAEGELDDEDLIEREDMVVTVTHGGYVKRTPLADYRAQARGGKGLTGMATKDEDFVTTLFVANTHTPILVFTTDGIAYKVKCWRLPLGARNARGRPVVNVLPVAAGVSIAAMMPVDAPEDDWEKLQILFATSEGDVRRNALSDFTNVMRNGKIAMKLPEGERLVGARICGAGSDVLLSTANGRAIRFEATDVRVFAGRDSTGVRGIRLADGDEVVSMAVIRHFEATPEERGAYLKMRRAVSGGGEEDAPADEAEGEIADIALPQERYAAMSAAEEMILTITSKGLGKRTSSHEYRITARGGQGIIAADLSPRKNDPDRSPAKVVAAWPVGEDDQIMLVTDAGQSIRCPVSDVSAMSRGARGVRVLNTADGERVVSVALIAEDGETA
jgi:DNA gyrase subunit A